MKQKKDASITPRASNPIRGGGLRCRRDHGDLDAWRYLGAEIDPLATRQREKLGRNKKKREKVAQPGIKKKTRLNVDWRRNRIDEDEDAAPPTDDGVDAGGAGVRRRRRRRQGSAGQRGAAGTGAPRRPARTLRALRVSPQGRSRAHRRVVPSEYRLFVKNR